MPKIVYEPWTPRGEAADVVAHAEALCVQYRRQGYALTLRGLYYQLVARGLFPDSRRFVRVGLNQWVRDPNGTKNAQPNYKWLIDLMTKARLGGLIDWYHLTDNNRGLSERGHWGSPESIIDSAAAGYAIDLWADQPGHVEVWVEKDALSNVVSRAAGAWDVPWMACKGYVSISEMWNAGQRLAEYIRDGKHVTILHLGDHDPSGIDMSRDIADRLYMFIGARRFDQLSVKRIALNMDQIQQFDPPSDPAKLGDSRTSSYVEQFGEECWELDALDPPVLDRLIRDEITMLVDHELYEARQARQDEERGQLTRLSERWADVVELLDEEEE